MLLLLSWLVVFAALKGVGEYGGRMKSFVVVVVVVALAILWSWSWSLLRGVWEAQHWARFVLVSSLNVDIAKGDSVFVFLKILLFLIAIVSDGQIFLSFHASLVAKYWLPLVARGVTQRQAEALNMHYIRQHLNTPTDKQTNI